MRTKQELEELLLPNIKTETLYRKWKRRYLGSLTKEHQEKCKYFMNLYKSEV